LEKVSIEKIKELRGQSGASVNACRNALIQAEENIEKAMEILKAQNAITVDKKKDRSTSQGMVEAYIHAGGRIGAMIELNCETDFVARTDEFKALAHNLAMQVAAMPPQYISNDNIPEGADKNVENACFLMQPYIKDLTRTVQDVINEVIGRTGENIKVSRFARFELGL